MTWDICPWCGSQWTERTDVICVNHNVEVCGNCGMCRKVAQIAYERKKRQNG